MNRMKHIKSYNESDSRPTFIWIHGLPGSGKSSLADSIMLQNPDGNFIHLDDIASLDKVASVLRLSENVILTSPYFENYFGLKLHDKLVELLTGYPNYAVKELWFSNDPKACISNVTSRVDHLIRNDTVIYEILNFSKKYTIPEGVETIPVWSEDK